METSNYKCLVDLISQQQMYDYNKLFLNVHTLEQKTLQQFQLLMVYNYHDQKENLRVYKKAKRLSEKCEELNTKWANVERQLKREDDMEMFKPWQANIDLSKKQVPTGKCN